MKLLIIVAVVFLVIPVVYIIAYIAKMGWNLYDQFWSGTMGNWLATLLGVAAGIPTGLWLNRLGEEEQKKQQLLEEREQEKLVFKLLLQELEANLESNLLKDELKEQIPATYLETSAWEAVTARGETGLIKDTELRADITNVYQQVRSLNEWHRRYLDARFDAASVLKIPDPESGKEVPAIIVLTKVLLNLATRTKPNIEQVVRKLQPHTEERE